MAGDRESYIRRATDEWNRSRARLDDLSGIKADALARDPFEQIQAEARRDFDVKVAAGVSDIMERHARVDTALRQWAFEQARLLYPGAEENGIMASADAILAWVTKRRTNV